MRPYIVLLAGILIGCQPAAPEEAEAAQDVITVAPSAPDFGSLQVGMTSGALGVNVNPGPGNTSDQIQAVSASCPDFSINAPNLPFEVYRVCEIVTCLKDCPVPNAAPNATTNAPCQTTDSQSYYFTATFHPTVAGTVSCVVTVATDTPSDNRTITLTGTGTLPPISVDVEPGSVAFGDVRIDTPSTAAQINVRSSGGQTLTVGSVSSSAGFAITGGPTAGYTLAPGATQPYTVVCQPAAVGPMSGQLVVSSDDPGRPTVTVPLSCNGIDSNLDISPSPAALPTTRVGEPLDAVIDLQNSGGAAMSLESVTLTGSSITMTAAPSPGTVLAAASGVAQVSVHFDAMAKGDASADLVATYDGGKTRSTKITARALATSMALNPDGDIDFGPVCGGHSKTQAFTLIANDQGGFALESISPPEAPFTVMPPALPLAVQGAGASQVKFQVVAAPAGDGVATSQIALATDIPGAANHVLKLTVEGLPAGVTATPAMVDLGSNPIDTTTIGQTVNLSNCGDAALTFSNPRIEGPDALEFAIVQQPMTSMIAPTGLASWLIVLQAHTVGVKAASFSVDYDGGTATIALAGEGLGDAPEAGGTSGRGSYYACSTGHPTALWPLGFALLLVLRRRRR